MNPRYRQLGYASWDDDLGWLAAWLDAESVYTGNLLVVTFPDGRTPTPYAGTIYRTLDMVPAAIRATPLPANPTKWMEE
jgi:hypothetical protein